MGFVHGDLPPSIKLENSTFLVNSHPILTQVPPNIIATPSPFVSSNKDKTTAGCFVGFAADQPKSRHVVPLGKLTNIRFMSIFRFKLWWSTHWVGSKGSDVEHETQMMILDTYVLLLPTLEGSFRACLQPGLDDDVDMCVESGSTSVSGSTFRSCLYMHVGDDPYNLIKEAMKVMRVHLETFKHLEEKTLPGIVEKFGWCTWDAFYLKVHPKGVYEGVKGLEEGGCPPGLVIIDDGWQIFCHDDEPVTDQGSINRSLPGEQMLNRLIRF